MNTNSPRKADMKYKITKDENSNTYTLFEVNTGNIIEAAHNDNVNAMRALIDKYIKLNNL